MKYYSLFAPEGTESDLLLAGLPTKIQVECLFGTVPVLACLTGEQCNQQGHIKRGLKSSAEASFPFSKHIPSEAGLRGRHLP